MSSIQVIKENSLGINRGLYGASFGNSLTSSVINTLLSEGAAVSVGTDAYNAEDEYNAWRYVGQESSLPKAAGTWRLLGCKNERVVPYRTNRFILPQAFIFGVGENMKAINEGATNGSGLVHGSIIHKGVAYPTYAAKLLGVDKNQNAIMQTLTDRDAIGAYGGWCYLIVELPYYVEAGDTIYESLMCFQTAHNDTGPGAFGATQFMSYNNKTRGADKFYRHNASDATTIQAWKDWADSADLAAVPTGANGGADQQIGWKSHGLIAWVDAAEWSVFDTGDSRDHGQDSGGSSNTDPDIDLYGANGESSHVYQNVGNVAIQTEKGADINDVSKFQRAIAAIFCNIGSMGYGINDLSVAGSAITKENTCVAAYAALLETIKSFIPKTLDVWICKTIAPSVVTSDYLTSLSGQAPQVVIPMRRINGAIRRGLVGNDGYIECHNSVSPSPDAGIYKVLPQSRVINTGTLTLSSVAATTDDAAYILGTASASIFNRDDNFLKGVLKGIATASAIPPTDLKFLIEYISATTIKLWLRGSKDNPVPYPTSWINGSLPLAVTLSANPLYIGADHYCDAAGTSYIHKSPEGEDADTEYNRSRGLPRL